MSSSRWIPVFLLLPFACGCTATGGRPTPSISQYPLDQASAVVFCADGSGGPGGTTNVLAQVASEQRAPLRVELVDWSHGERRYFADQFHWRNIERSGLRLAEQVKTLRARHPDKRIHFVGQSAGCAVVLVAASSLPADGIDRIILLAPSVSTRCDLRPALACAREGIDVFYSRQDWVVLGLGMMGGTTDRDLAAAAGRVGFRKFIWNPGDAELYEKLRQHQWEPSVSWTGNTGRHFGSSRAGYVSAYVLPLLTGGGQKHQPWGQTSSTEHQRRSSR
jgi:pimeloyl-ACP methyl ester carboxylesterase